mgnify:CR=1 FL=1
MKQIKYHVEFKLNNSNKLFEMSFDSMLERALMIISYSLYCDVIREWVD